MAYELSEFCADAKDILSRDGGADGREKIRQKLEALLQNEAFVDEVCGPEAPMGITTLYHDPDLDFMVLAHVYPAGRTSPPHDHGASWAIYGQAIGWTDMTEYDRLDDGKEEGHADLEERRKYRLEPGHAGMFGPHQIHSIHFPDHARFVRVTGTDLTHIPTLRYDMAKRAVTRVNPNNVGDVAGSVSA